MRNVSVVKKWKIPQFFIFHFSFFISLAALASADFKIDPSVMGEKYWQIWNDAEQAKIDADIEANRKADGEFVIEAPEGTEVKVEMLDHEFKFGAHIFNFNQLGRTVYNDAYKASYGPGGIFNSATVAFYWDCYEPISGRTRPYGDYEDTERFWNSLTREEAMEHKFWRRPAPGPVVNFCREKGIRIHGHILVWGSAKPFWIYDLWCPEDEKRECDRLGIPRNGTATVETDNWEGGYKFAWKAAWEKAYKRTTERELAAKMPEWDPRTHYGDVFERALYNAFFSAQSGDGLKYRYFTPFEAKAEWWNRDTYCCPNNFKRMVFEIPDAVFRRAGGGLAVCLYTSAELKSGGIAAKMTTAYPEDGKVTLDVTLPAGEKSLYLRIPRWCPSATVRVAGAAETAPSGWYRLCRDFSAGVRIELELPMPIRLVKGCRAQEGRVAVLRGPCVYALERGVNGLPQHGVDLWDLDVSQPLTWHGEKHAVEVGVKCRHLARETRKVLLTRYFREARERTYFIPTGPCSAIDDEIAPPQ